MSLCTILQVSLGCITSQWSFDVTVRYNPTLARGSFGCGPHLHLFEALVISAGQGHGMLGCCCVSTVTSKRSEKNIRVAAHRLMSIIIIFFLIRWALCGLFISHFLAGRRCQAGGRCVFQSNVVQPCNAVSDRSTPNPPPPRTRRSLRT